MSQQTYYATGPDGTIAVSDNYGTEDKQGKSLFADVTDAANVSVSENGFLAKNAGHAASLSLSRDQAIGLRNWLNDWLERTSA